MALPKRNQYCSENTIDPIAFIDLFDVDYNSINHNEHEYSA
jgi:hypothetical protein